MSENILQIAEKLNSEVARLNNERSKMEGMLESAKSNFERAVQAYSTKYGVTLTAENLQSEYNEVYAKTQGSILDLQEKIESIKRGDYKKSESISFNLEPDVEPIRAEKEVVKIPDVNAFGEISEADDISKDSKGVKEGIVDVVEKPDEVVAEPEKKRGRPRKTGAVSPELLKQAVAAESVQEVKPVIPDGMLLEDADDGEDVAANVSTKEVVSDVNELDFGNIDFSFGESSVEQSESKNVKTSDDEVNLENLDFGGFGDIGKTEDTKENVTEPKKENPFDLDFGGFGDIDFNNLAGTTEKVVKEENKDEPITPAGWGSDFEFNFDGTNDILGNTKFGE